MNEEVRYFAGTQSIQSQRYYATVLVSSGRLQITPTAKYVGDAERVELDETDKPITVNIAEITKVFSFFNSVTIQQGNRTHYFVFGPLLRDAKFFDKDGTQQYGLIATALSGVIAYFRLYSKKASEFKQQIRPSANKTSQLSQNLAPQESPEAARSFISFRVILLIVFLIAYPIIGYIIWTNYISS